MLRDQDTIEALAKRLPGMRRIVLVGNGGIALEVAHTLTGIEVMGLIPLSNRFACCNCQYGASVLLRGILRPASPPNNICIDC